MREPLDNIVQWVVENVVSDSETLACLLMLLVVWLFLLTFAPAKGHRHDKR